MKKMCNAVLLSMVYNIISIALDAFYAVSDTNDCIQDCSPTYLL